MEKEIVLGEGERPEEAFLMMQLKRTIMILGRCEGIGTEEKWVRGTQEWFERAGERAKPFKLVGVAYENGQWRGREYKQSRLNKEDYGHAQFGANYYFF